MTKGKRCPADSPEALSGIRKAMSDTMDYKTSQFLSKSSFQKLIFISYFSSSS
jgi:hypothetical protein